MKTIEELQAQLKQICAELDAMKAAQTPETPETNFKEIAAKASRYPITGHPLANEDEHTKEMYMLMLMSVIVLDSEKYTESFMTFYRIAAGMGYSGNAEELMLKAQTLKFETLDECTRLFGKDDKRLILLLECMLIAAQFDKGKRKAMEYIAELASLMNVTKEQITFLSNLARVVLTQDLNEYKTDLLNTYGELFDCYINDFGNEFNIEIVQAERSDWRGYQIYFVSRNNNEIILKYGMHVSPCGWQTYEYVKKLQNEYVDYIKTTINTENMRWGEKNVILGVTSNHPLVHSKAIAQYLDAGGKIE